MRKIIASVWLTIDGIFDADTMPEWFFPFDSMARGEYIRNSILDADALLIGRTTYEMLAAYWPTQLNDDNGPASKINSMKKYVVSTKLEKAGWNNSTIINKNIVEEIKNLKQQPGNEIQIPGSATLVHSLLKENLIDELRLLVHPILIGNGKRFFNDDMKTSGMKLTKTQTLDKGVVLLCYEIINQ
jgi:dihydrofolate reductase